jgi:hypothetical protein
LRKTQISQIFIEKGTIRLKNARAYFAGTLPPSSAVMFSTVYFCQFCDIKNLANFSEKNRKSNQNYQCFFVQICEVGLLVIMHKRL